MTGTRPTSAEQHLGDRLSALVDGELGHDSRERVLAHLATCAKCKAEADAQRRLKNVFAEVAPPTPSESFLARLQGLPGGTGPDSGLPPLGGGSGDRFGSGVSGVFGAKREEPFEFAYVPAREHGSLLPPSHDRGFRIHAVHRSDDGRSRGLRFAFAAAGAVSLAAIALGGMNSAVPADTDARGGSGAGSNVTPARTPGSGSSAAPDAQRRRAVGPLLAQGGQTLGDVPAAPTQMSAPLLPGVPSPPVGPVEQTLHRLTTPVVAGAAAMSPLIRPLVALPPLPLSNLLSVTPVPGASSTSSSPRNAR